MNHKFSSERGQALVIVAFAIIGLVAITGLAIDGGMAFSDRRHAQNAADTAAIAGALARVGAQKQGLSSADVQAAMIVAAKDRANENGFSDDKITNTVDVHNPPISGPYANCASALFDCNDFVQVIISHDRDTYFSRVIGIEQTHNLVSAVSAAKFGINGPLYGGASIVGLAPNQCKTIWFSGNSELKIWGGGVFSNSNLDCGLTIQGSTDNTLYDGGIDMVANAYTLNGNPPMSIAGGIHGGATPYPYPPPSYMLPNPTCSGPASKSGSAMNPGSWSGNFPPSGVKTLNPGTYCVNGEFRVNANEELSGTGVTIFMQSGGITWNGKAEINLSAPASGPLAGLLIYAPMSNSSPMKFNGNGDSHLRGLIFTPAADITFNGTSDVHKSYVQIVGYTVELTGDNGTLIQYQDPDNWDAVQPPQVGLSE